MDLSVSTRSMLDQWTVVLVVGLLILAGGVGFLAYDAHTEDRTATEEHRIGELTVDSAFDHSATVQTDTTIFSAGEQLEDRTLYFASVAPELTGTHTLEQANSDGVDATASVTVTSILRSVDDNIVHWERETELDSADVTIPDGGDHETTVTLDIPTVLDEVADIESELAAAPGETEIALVAETSVEATVEDESLSEQRTDRLLVEPDNGIYRVDSDATGSNRLDVTEERTVGVQPSAVRLYGLPGLAALALVGAVGLIYGRTQGMFAVSEQERERYDFEAARADFDDWISRARVPSLGDRTVIPVESLADLVDVAIDSDRRVIESVDSETYVVLVDDIAYRFSLSAESQHGEAGSDTGTGGEDDTIQANSDDETEQDADSAVFD